MAAATTAAPRREVALDERVHARRWLTLGVLCLSLLIIVMDNTILNVAIPSLISDLDASNSEMQWIIDAYTLVFAGLLLTTGSLSDRFGRKGALQIGIVVFAIGSASAALSTTHAPPHRQPGVHGHRRGADHAVDAVDPDQRVPRPTERGRAIAIWAGFSGLAVALGPVTGGLLLRALLVELGVLGQPAARRRGPRRRLLPRPDVARPEPWPARPARRRAVDRRPGVAAVRHHRGPGEGWTDPSCSAGFAIGVVALASLHRLGAAHADPMLDMRFFRNPRFTAANSAITLTFFALFGSMFLMTQYWQFVHGYSPLGAGVRMIPYALTMMVVAPLSARVVERVGTKRVVTAGLLIIAAALLSLSFIQATRRTCS